MPHQPYRALYIHIPFCVKRCGYCDFTTAAVPRDDVRIDEYVEQLVVDLRRQAKAGELIAIETVYLGGGTPSHIGLSRLSSLLYALSVSVDLTREGLCAQVALMEEKGLIAAGHESVVNYTSIERFCSSAIGKRMKSAARVWRELPFSRMIPVGKVNPAYSESAEKIFIQA